MTLQEIAVRLQLDVVVGGKGLGKEVTWGYCSDLLSDVMAHAREGCVWLTLQTHQNVVAVAVLVGVRGVVITGGRTPEQGMADRASQEGVVILASREPTFDVAGRLYSLLAGG